MPGSRNSSRTTGPQELERVTEHRRRIVAGLQLTQRVADLRVAVAEADRRAFYTLCEYYAARRFWVLMGSRADTRLGPRSKSWKNVFDAIKAIMDDASSRAAALGYSVDAENTWTFSRLGFDSIEPEVTA